MRTIPTGTPSRFGRWLRETLLLCIALGLASCGGGDSQGTGSNQAMRAAIIAVPAPSVTVTGITKVSETRVSRTVYDYVFQVTVKNNGSGPQSGVTATLTGVGTGTTIIDGTVQVGDLAAGATVTPQDTITLRQDRTYAFNSAALIWQVTASSNSTTTVINSGGGTATSADGNVTIQVPAGAVPTSAEVTIAPSEGQAGQTGTLYQVTGSDGTDLTFQQPVTLQIKYDPALLPAGTSEANLQIGLLGPFESWEILTDSTVDTVNKVITATTTHFSKPGVLSASSNGGPTPRLSFPLPGRDPFTAVINSVFDHSMENPIDHTIVPYCEDDKVQAYTGDTSQGVGTSCINYTKNINACGNHKTIQVDCDYGTGGAPVTYKNGNTDPTIISYDGHPGYDYRTVDQPSLDGVAGHIQVLAAADGVAHVADWNWGAIYIDHGNGYETHYLHLFSTSIYDGKPVKRGDVIGVAGNRAPKGFVIGPHLHFEVRNSKKPIDPYELHLWVVPLNAIITGSGSGRVVSGPSTATTTGIDCSVGTCTALYDSGASVSLIAMPAAGAVFTGWSGGSCSGVGSCNVTMNGSVTVSATFSTSTQPPPGTIDKLFVPGAVSTQPAGINDSGVIVGTYQDTSIVMHGFVYSGGTYSTLDFPGATYTNPHGINNNGTIVGEYQDTSSVMHGFIYLGGTYTTLDVPGSGTTYAAGINGNGEIVGGYIDNSGVHGFVYSSGTFTTLDPSGTMGLNPMGINNNGDIVGYFSDVSGMHGFIYGVSSFQTLDVPGCGSPQAGGINGTGMIVGICQGNSGSTSFVYSGGAYTVIPVTPNYIYRGINNNGSIVGLSSPGGSGFVKW